MAPRPFEAHHPRHSAQLEWAAPAGSALLDPAELVQRLGRLASDLAGCAAGEPVVSVDLEHLQLLGEVQAGERLVATAALFGPSAGGWPVSLLVRRAHGRRQPVAMVGVLRFTRAGSRLLPSERLERGTGRARVATSFRVRSTSPDVLVSGNVLSWVHASAQLCAQGHAACGLAALGLEAVSLHASIEPNEQIDLECSILRDSGPMISVVTELRSATRVISLGRAISRFRKNHPEGPLGLRSTF